MAKVASAGGGAGRGDVEVDGGPSTGEKKDGFMSRVVDAARVPVERRSPEQISCLASFLSSVAKLRQFQPSTIMELVREMATLELKRAEMLFEQGDLADAYDVLVMGKCALYIREEDEEGLGVWGKPCIRLV
ncbi:unnamed protein product [Ostreobium quekettii]|uniref:Cyclic nucleotide-binding domain-containing protein n=1 Tax=Ostreobium quekettii TaxID=121088 RepID=A0A8S1J380_9CHLO|nr:unnamed protein product [Ostreobium quekettii]